MNIKNKSALIIFILIPLAAGSLSALLSGNSAAYLALNKPPLSPPSFLFPIVWTILYILLGISSYIIYESETPEKNKALRLYFIQLFFNFFWSIIFFSLQAFGFALIWLLLLWVLILCMVRAFWKVDKIAAWLQIPYLLWVTFAAYLNFGVWRLN